jgi:hypothetical protein
MVDSTILFVTGVIALAALAWQYRRLEDVDAESAYDYHRAMRRASTLGTHLEAVQKDLESLRQAAAKKASVRETEGLLAEAIAELVGGKEKTKATAKAKA